MPMRRSSTSFVPTPPIAAMPGIPYPRSALALAVLCALAAGPALAQTADSANAPAAPASAEPIQEVVITGSQIRGVSAAGSKSVVLDRETLLQTGYNNPIDVLKTVPQVQGLGYGDTPSTAQNGSANVQRGSTIALRGLNSSATLVLIDGRRIAPTGNVTTFTEANQLPVSFIERIDVVADGASAIYGSDAVAGVVNYITRKSYDGVEITPRFTHTHGYRQKGASIVAGHTVKDLGGMGKLSIVAAYDHDQRDAMLQGSTPFARQDLSAFGGLDNRIRTNLASSGAPGNIIVAGPGRNPVFPSAGNFTYYGVPPGYGGTGLTGAGLLPNRPNLLDASDYTDLLPETKRDQASLNLNLQIDAKTRLYYQAYYNRREHTALGLVQPNATLTLPASSPYYIPGVPGVAPGAPQTVSFSFLKDIGRAVIDRGHAVASGHGNTIGLQRDFDNKWRAEAIFSATGTKTCANCIPALNGNIFTQQLQAALNDGSYNPFSSTAASPDVLRRFLVEGNDRNRVKMQQASLRFDGPLFALPGGMVRAAVGAESLGIEQWRDSIGIKATSDTVGAYGKRRINAVYGELSVPLVGPDNSLPLVQRFSLNLAGRSQKYSDVGRTSNPKIGFVWGVNGDLALRGAAGTSFRAPDLTDANTTFFSSVSTQLLANGANDPAIPLSNTATRQSYVLRLGGSNPALTPEKAKNFSLGADYKPSFIDGLRLGASLYRIKYDNQIVGLQTVSSSFIANPANRAVYAPYIVPAAQPAGCVPGNRGTYNPIYAEAFGEPTLSTPDETNACRLTALFIARNTNTASTVQDGLDLDFGYEMETAYGRFNADLNATKILDNKVRVSPLAGEADDLDRMNMPVSLRGRGAIGWNQGQWSASFAMNYVGSYLNDLPVTVAGVTNPKVEIDAWKTFDLHLAWRSAAKGGLFGGTRLSFNIQNVFDRDPPVVLSTNNNAAFAYDPQNANVLGRVVSVQLSKAF